MTEGYDPLELGKIVYPKVCKIENDVEYRKYYRFRGGRWYGGIATGDVVGCNMRCRFCWSWTRGSYRTDIGTFYSPKDALSKILSIALERKYRYIRLSGAEPTLSKKHLLDMLKLLENMNVKVKFILETNGIEIGVDDEFARQLSRFSKLIVRVSIKGTSPETFHKITGAKPEYFHVQLKALEKLVEYGMRPGEQVYPAVMLSFSPKEEIEKFIELLRNIHPALAENIDPEYVILYPHVVKLLKKYNLKPLVAYTPDNIPTFMI